MDNSKNILTDEEIKVAIHELFRRCQTDWEFRELCLRDPAAAILEISGKNLPEGFDLQFRDSNDKPA